MKITIEEQSPDGINISVDNLIVDTTEEANQFISWIMKIWDKKKIDLEECKRIYESTQNKKKKRFGGK
jgi:hypothetical protein